MSAAASFPDEKWILEIEGQIRKEMQSPPPPSITTRIIIHDMTVHSPTVVLSIFLYDSLEEGHDPIHGMQVTMNMEPIQRRLHHHQQDEEEQVGQERLLLALEQQGVLPLNEALIEYQLNEDALRYSLLH